ncbi:MAG: amidohydrolase [Nocardioides sp.]
MNAFVLRRARIVELGRRPGWQGPVDVLVEAGVVREVGHDLDRPAGLDEFDADGRWLIPGLWDQHVHLGQWTANRDRLDLAGTESPEDAVARVRRVAAARTRPLVAWGHRTGLWNRDPTVAELDEAAPDVPVFLISGDGHHAWVNSRGLTALGLAPRDEIVTENEWFDSHARLAEIAPPDLSPAAYATTLRDAAALGVTGLVDLEFGAAPDAWVDRPTPLRVRTATYADGLDAVIDAGLRTGAELAGPLVTMGPLKIISDGSLNTRTAWCCEEYDDGSGAGAPNQSDAELVALLAEATAHGLEVATHAIGDRAVTAALDAYETTAARGSIEHAQLLTRPDVRRLARLGLRASVQPAHLLDDRDVTELVWSDRADRCFAFRWMLDAGVRMAFGSDAPVSPLDPWLAVAAAVHRSADERPAWHPEQAIGPREALAASVDGQGSVHAGMRADLVLVDADPLAEGTAEQQAQRLREMPVAVTWVAGQAVHGGLPHP